MLLPKLHLHSVEPLALWDFCSIFLSNTAEDQKHVISERGAHGIVPYGKFVPIYCITFIKGWSVANAGERMLSSRPGLLRRSSRPTKLLQR